MRYAGNCVKKRSGKISRVEKAADNTCGRGKEIYMTAAYMVSAKSAAFVNGRKRYAYGNNRGSVGIERGSPSITVRAYAYGEQSSSIGSDEPDEYSENIDVADDNVFIAFIFRMQTVIVLHLIKTFDRSFAVHHCRDNLSVVRDGLPL